MVEPGGGHNSPFFSRPACDKGQTSTVPIPKPPLLAHNDGAVESTTTTINQPINPFLQFALASGATTTEQTEPTTTTTTSTLPLHPPPKSALPPQPLPSKWQAFSPRDLPLPTRRYQILVSARLHARCTAPVVRAAMKALRSHFSSFPGGFCAANVASCEVEELAKVISSVHYNNSKAAQIVKASNQVLELGGVPERADELLKLTGIGEKLAGLLAKVNTKEEAMKYMEDQGDNADNGVEPAEEVGKVEGERARSMKPTTPSSPLPVSPPQAQQLPSLPVSSDCPLCGKSFLTKLLPRHAAECGLESEPPVKKKHKVENNVFS